jgi:hypothetical protein
VFLFISYISCLLNKSIFHSIVICGTVLSNYLVHEIFTFIFSRNSIVSIATGYWLDGPGSIPGSARFFSSPERLDRLGPTQPRIRWVPGALSPGVKRQGRDADHSPPSTAKVKTGGAITVAYVEAD